MMEVRGTASPLLQDRNRKKPIKAARKGQREDCKGDKVKNFYRTKTIESIRPIAKTVE